MRIAQLLNPHSFLTRHLRAGRWPGLPQFVDELLIVADAAISIGLIGLGALGLAAFGRGPMGIAIAGVLLYHVAVIAALAGLTRFRVPLEPLLTIYAALALANWGAVRDVLHHTRWRRITAASALAILTPLVLWHLPDGWPGWQGW